MTETEINQRFSDKVRRGIFNPVARFLTNLSTAEDQLQDAVAQTWLMFRRYARDRGKVLDDGILVHSCRQRAVDLGRRFVGSNGATCRNQDALDPRAYRDGTVEVLRLDGAAGDNVAGYSAMAVGWAETLAANPSRKLRSAYDLLKWLGQLSHRDRSILEARMLGYSLGQIAADLGLTTSTVYTRARKLGLELAVRAGIRILTGGSRRKRTRPAA